MDCWAWLEVKVDKENETNHVESNGKEEFEQDWSVHASNCFVPFEDCQFLQYLLDAIVDKRDNHGDQNREEGPSNIVVSPSGTLVNRVRGVYS